MNVSGPTTWIHGAEAIQGLGGIICGIVRPRILEKWLDLDSRSTSRVVSVFGRVYKGACV